MLGPFEGSGHGFVAILNEGQDFGAQVVERKKIALLGRLAYEYAQPGLT